MICGSGGSKSRLAKAAGAEPSGQMRDEKLHAVFTFGALLEAEMSKSARRSRSTFPSQNVQSTSAGVGNSPILGILDITL